MSTKKEIYANRFKNLDFIIKRYFNGVKSALADELGIKRPQIYRVYSETKTKRNVGEDTARLIENHYQLSPFWMDQKHNEYNMGLDPNTNRPVLIKSLKNTINKIHQQTTDLSTLGSVLEDKNSYSVQQPWIPVIEWHEISKYLNSNDKKTEFKTMPIDEKLNDGAFYLKVASNAFAPYINKGETAIIEPKPDTLGEPVLVEYKGEFIFCRHVKALKESLRPINDITDANAIPVNAETKIIGIVNTILSSRKG